MAVKAKYSGGGEYAPSWLPVRPSPINLYSLLIIILLYNRPKRRPRPSQRPLLPQQSSSPHRLLPPPGAPYTNAPCGARSGSLRPSRPRRPRRLSRLLRPRTYLRGRNGDVSNCRIVEPCCMGATDTVCFSEPDFFTSASLCVVPCASAASPWIVWCV